MTHRPIRTPPAVDAPREQAGAYTCPECGFAVWQPLWEFDETVAGLYDDARYPGRCLLALRVHATHLDELDPVVIATLMEDAARLGAAIRMAVHADRINYAVLGNTEPHVHVHVIPRLHRTDPVPRRPPWEHPDPVTPLAPDRRRGIAQSIVEALSSRTGPALHADGRAAANPHDAAPRET